ncbi:hypothetical protein [Streptomyces sp. NPDC095613]|uniref:hypothetical protein n=1 Tax=Streptomyces sp. NPDC095613 TaxID=3155540 RepID=UPI00331BEFCB
MPETRAGTGAGAGTDTGADTDADADADADAGVSTGRTRAWASAALLVNLLLGVPAVVPVFLLWYFASNWPLAAIGWTQGEPTENDGMLPWFLFAGPIVIGFPLLWLLVNIALRRRTGWRPRLFWPVSALLTLGPTAVLMAVL